MSMTDSEKRDSVKRNYDLIAEQYAKDFGCYIEDLDVYKVFEDNLVNNAKILDLGAGTGRTHKYFNEKGYDYIGLDFSKQMKKLAFEIHGEFPFIIDDMVNIKKYFSKDSIDAVFAVYSLFHLPMLDFKKLLKDIYDILKDDGVFLFSYQIGHGEEMTDEPYLGEKGKKCLYINYQTDDEIKELLDTLHFEIVYRKEKIENSAAAINSKSITTAFLLVKKVKIC